MAHLSVEANLTNLDGSFVGLVEVGLPGDAEGRLQDDREVLVRGREVQVGLRQVLGSLNALVKLLCINKCRFKRLVLNNNN